MTNWNDPASRAALIERVGVAEYNRLHAEHMKKSVVGTFWGRDVRTVGSAFGTLYAVDGAGVAFTTLEEAKTWCGGNPLQDSRADEF